MWKDTVVKVHKQGLFCRRHYPIERKKGRFSILIFYDQVREVELEAQIRTIEASHEAQKYGEVWKVVNEISGRKRAREGQVEG